MMWLYNYCCGEKVGGNEAVALGQSDNGTSESDEE